MSEQEKQQDPADKYRGRMDELLDHDRDKSANIHQRIHSIMKDVWYVKKEGEVGSKYKTVEHDDVTRKIRPALVRHGVTAKIQDLQVDEPRIVPIEKYNNNSDEYYTEKHFLTQAELKVRFTNIDNPDDYVETPSYNITKDKQPLTLSGKVLSYAVKMAILKTFTLETGVREDTDTLTDLDTDLNAVATYNDLGETLFGKERWQEIGPQKIYSVTKQQTSEASRAPTHMLNAAIRKLWELKKKKDENPDKSIEEINKEQKKENGGNDITDDLTGNIS